MAIRIEMLGPPMLRGEGGEPLPFSAGKPFALLAYLAITRSRMARLVLAELLWGRATERSARASLRQAIFTIRRDIDPDLLVGDDPIGLDLDRFTTDVAEFRQHLVTGRAAAAAELWRGRFLEGLSVSGAPEFEHWSDGVAASLSRDLSAALQAEARALRSRGDAGGALRLLEQAARLEPDSVGAQLRFAEALAEVGDRSALDILGAIDTGAIEADVAAECARLRGLLVGAAPSKPRSAAGDAMPFVGRRGELARMAEAWRGVRGGTAQVLAITGPAGIGKTRLAREFAAGIASGARLIEVRGVAVERPIPFGLIADWRGCWAGSRVRAVSRMRRRPCWARSCRARSDGRVRGLRTAMNARSSRRRCRTRFMT